MRVQFKRCINADQSASTINANTFYSSHLICKRWANALTWTFARCWHLRYRILYVTNELNRNVRTEPKRTFWHVCAPYENSNQPAHLRSLIRVSALCAKKPCIFGYPRCAKWRFRSGWSESSLGARWWRYVLLRCGSVILKIIIVSSKLTIIFRLDAWS